MRRARTAVAAAGAVLAAAWPGTAAAAPPSADVHPEALCTVTDGRITELSGMAAGREHLYLMNDGGKQVTVYEVSRDCSVQDLLTSGINPYDPEDLARADDGTLWVADIGDNSHRRATIALITLRPGGGSTLYRLTYPDGAHNAEALLLGPGGTPYLITKDALGSSGVYRPAGPLTAHGTTPLHRVATIELGPTDTPGGPLPAGLSSVLVTGAALSRDGTVLAVRTYTDAYLYAVPHGDVAAALTERPVRVALPHEPQGEAIAFGPHGALLAGGEGTDQPIVRIPHATALVQPAGSPDVAATPGAGASAAAPAARSGAESPWWYLIGGGIGLAGAMVAWFLVAWRKSRERG